MNYPILLVEDDTLLAQALSLKLKMKGFEVLHAANGEDAIVLATKHNPCLILLDVNMPKIDGFEVLKRLKGNPSTRDIHIMMITTRNFEHEVLDGLGSGAHDYIIKPFDLEQVAARIEKNYRKADSEQKDRAKNIVRVNGNWKEAEASSQYDTFHVLLLSEHPLNVYLSFGNTVNIAITVAKTVAEARIKMEKLYYPLVIIDCDLPDKQGYRYVEETRFSDRNEGILRFMVGIGSRNKSSDDVWLISGMNDYFKKPISTEIFKNILSNYEKEIQKLPQM